MRLAFPIRCSRWLLMAVTLVVLRLWRRSTDRLLHRVVLMLMRLMTLTTLYTGYSIGLRSMRV